MVSTPRSRGELLGELGLEHVVDVGHDAAVEERLDQVAWHLTPSFSANSRTVMPSAIITGALPGGPS